MRIYKKFTALLLGLALTAPSLGWASPENPTSVNEVIEAVEATYASATSIRAEFLQVDRSKALGTEVRQRGRISLERPQKMRVEMGMPVTQVFVNDGKTMWSYSVKEKVAYESPEMGGGGGMDILLEDLGRLGELFDVTLLPQNPPAKPSVTVKLVPKKPGAFKSLELTLSKPKYVLQDLVLINQFDDVTEMNFTAVRMNQDIPDAEFTFVAPPGVKVVKTGAM